MVALLATCIEVCVYRHLQLLLHCSETRARLHSEIYYGYIYTVSYMNYRSIRLSLSQSLIERENNYLQIHFRLPHFLRTQKTAKTLMFHLHFSFSLKMYIKFIQSTITVVT